MASTDTSEKRHTVSSPLSKDDYLAKAGAPQPGFQRTQDGVDANVGHTSQSVQAKGGSVGNPLNETPGQVFETWQLPDPQVAIDAGLPPVVVPADLIVDSGEEQGSEPLDVLSRDLRKRLGDPRLDESGYSVKNGSGETPAEDEPAEDEPVDPEPVAEVEPEKKSASHKAGSATA